MFHHIDDPTPEKVPTVYMLDQIVTIARNAGDMLRREFRRDRRVDFKSRAELVTDMDLASEQLIIKQLSSLYPDYDILSEESAHSDWLHFTDNEPANPIWLIDPLDGTNNYAHGIPFFSVSIALVDRGMLMLGVVYDPIHDECFAVERTSPPRLNGNPIVVSTVDDLRHAQLSTGFPYDRWSRTDSNAEAAAAMVMQCQDLRRMGSAALDLCYVAAGRHDGHWEVELKPWDGAAGALMIQAAGGSITDMTGKPYRPWGGGVVASNKLIHAAMLDVLAKPNEQRV